MSSFEEISEDNNNFIYNNMLACALLQIFPKKDRINIHNWLEKLQKITGNKEKLITRDNYLWQLLLMMQKQYLIEPFDKSPPKGELIPISEILSAKIQKEIFCKDKNFSWIDKIIKETNNIDENEIPIAGISPRKFLNNQPKPINGILTYFSVFSKQS